MKSKRMLSNAWTLMVVASLMSSCEKMTLTEGNGQDEAQKGNVVLRVSQFEQIPFSSLTRAGVQEVCTRLNFAIYDTDGSRIKQINQKAGDSGFGTVEMTLAEGDYQVVALAHSSNGNPTMTNLNKIKFSNAPNGTGFSDTFLYYGTISVAEEEGQEYSIVLQRITALLRFVIEDEIPTSVTKFVFRYTGGSGTFDATTGYGNVNSSQIMEFSVDGTQKEFDLYTIPKDETGELDLYVYANNQNDITVLNREFEAIPIKRNMITRFAGNFFTGTSGSTWNYSFSLQVEDSWGGQTDYGF